MLPLTAVTVTVPLRVVVEVVGVVLLDAVPPPPQLTSASEPTTNSNVIVSVATRFRFPEALRLEAKQSAAMPPVIENKIPDGMFFETAELFAMVKVAAPLPATELGATEQAVLVNDDETEQLSVTVPLNPFTAVIVSASVAEAPFLNVSAVLAGVRLKSPVAPTPTGHDAASAPTSTVPSPVAMSYPIPALNPIVPVVQSGVPIVQGTLLSPLTMS